jgi:hypothetical protein
MVSLKAVHDGSDADYEIRSVRLMRVQYNPANDEEIRQDQNRPSA